MVDEHGNKRYCAEIMASGRALASDLAAAGIRRGDRIAVQLQNGALYVDMLAAAALGGFVVMSVNARFAPALADSIIERSGARMVVRSAADLPPQTDDEPDLTPPTADDRFVIFTTSGTTSAPKLVVHQQRSIAAHAADVATAFGYGNESVVMVPVPLCGVFGFTVLWGALAGQATVIMPTAFDAEETGRLVQEHGVTSLHGSDDMFHRLLATDWDLSSVQSSGYARFNSALDGIVERCDARGVPLSGLYGMSEVQALYAFRGASGLPIEKRWRAAGDLVSPDAERRVVDDELQLQGPSLFEGYLADGGAEIDHQLTMANFDGPWFKTGDLAVEDGPRSFEYITRIGDVMRLGGFLVAPAEVEGAIMRFDEIDQAQVVAVEREQGARPVAFVILAPGVQLDEQAVIDHCAEILARFKCPVRVVAVDEFPVTDGPNGVKIQRAKLRSMCEALLSG
jgi:fatty-acyl-CoA synthase